MSFRDPFRELEALRREFDRALGEAGPGRRGGRRRQAFLPGRAARQYPLINLYDDGATFTVEALAPGVNPDQLEITVVGNRLTLSGEKPGPGEVAAERMHRTERAAGRFVRTFDLPVEVDADKVTAQYRNGLLLLTLPRAEAVKPCRVMVTSE